MGHSTSSVTCVEERGVLADAAPGPGRGGGRLGPDVLLARLDLGEHVGPLEQPRVVAGAGRSGAARARGSGARGSCGRSSRRRRRPGRPPGRGARAATARAARSSAPRPPSACCFLNSMPCTAAPSTPGRSALAGRPASVTSAARYSPLGVWTFRSAATATPCASANLVAARVGAPSGPKAAFTEGPSAWRVASGLRSTTASTSTASRRGVAKVRAAPWASRAPSSAREHEGPELLHRRAPPRAAGSSSVPISKSSSSLIGFDSARNDVPARCWPATPSRMGGLLADGPAGLHAAGSRARRDLAGTPRRRPGRCPAPA